MSIIFERVPVPYEVWLANARCQLRIQLTFWLGKFVVVFVVSGFVPCSYLYYMIVVLGSSRYCYHDWFVGVFTPLFGALVKGEVFWQCHLCAGNVIRIFGCVPWLEMATRWVIGFFALWNWYLLDFFLVQVQYLHWFRIPPWCPAIGSDVPFKLETGVRLRNITTPCVGACWIWVVVDLEVRKH